MEKLFDDLLILQETTFPFDNCSTLTEYTHKKSYVYVVPLAAEFTAANRMISSYCCTFGGVIKSKMRETIKSMCRCPAKLIFQRTFSNGAEIMTFMLNKSTVTHSHPVSPEYYGAFRNILTSEQINSIKDQQRVGVLAGTICSNMNCCINSDIFYNIRRNINVDNSNENLNILLTELQYTHD
ncbi:hypothetical protein TRFO_38413 [Tritrichomonas foetus]|uniref:FAR1 domain-containing protein n=1 Tax=Tritrichomonas foetus TaxID=1144522 RepID=A0A1J4JE11_9EUKA|nr:hypothetical protein TRFO_38413 [Tritrichomonas foetus]|eukprot:OHS95492.1 hypothetical protein TRFO_38413 [Tritrichomonas foetus]